MIKRYAQTENRNGLGFYDSISGDDEGGFVSYEDYMKLSAECDRVKAQRDYNRRLADHLTIVIDRKNAEITALSNPYD